MKKSGKILKVGCLSVMRGRDTPIRGDTGGGWGYRNSYPHPIPIITPKIGG
jgi:hypothetical protein